MSLKSFSLIEAAFTQGFFSQISNMQYGGNPSSSVISISYQNENNEDTILIGLDEDKQGKVPEGSDEGLKALSKLETKWISWLDNQITQYKNNYNIASIYLSYDAANPLNVDLSIKLKPVSSTQP